MTRISGCILGSYFRMLIARAITSAPMPRDTTASIINSRLAHRLIAEMPVGLNAVAVQKASGATGHQRSPGAAALSGATGG
jgi:hypothetical protein